MIDFLCGSLSSGGDNQALWNKWLRLSYRQKIVLEPATDASLIMTVALGPWPCPRDIGATLSAISFSAEITNQETKHITENLNKMNTLQNLSQIVSNQLRELKILQARSTKWFLRSLPKTQTESLIEGEDAWTEKYWSKYLQIHVYSKDRKGWDLWHSTNSCLR